MIISTQDAVTAGILVAALCYVARHIVRAIRRKGPPDCGCCLRCPPDPPEEPLVHLDDPPENG